MKENTTYETQLENPEQLIGEPLADRESTFTTRQAMLYAIAIGFSQDPLKQADLKYTFELSPQFSVFPIFGTCFRKTGLIKLFQSNPNLPKFNPAMVLHAQQRIQLIQPALKPNTQYITKSKILQICEKGKMTLISSRLETFQKVDGQLKICLINQSTLAIRNFKANGYKGTNKMTPIPKIPNRNPDLIIQDRSFKNQAILYRLTGDDNPLHIDPKFAAIQKFQKPILHGLATKGIVARAIVQKVLNNQPVRLKSFHSRFLGHVFPGQSFQIKIWKGQKQNSFEVTCKERGTKVLMGSFQQRQNAKL